MFTKQLLRRCFVLLAAGVVSVSTALSAGASPRAGAVAGYVVVSDQESASGNNPDSATAYCPTNMGVVGGGYTTAGGKMRLVDQYPVNLSAWSVVVYNLSPAAGTVTAFAECSRRVIAEHNPSPPAFYAAAHHASALTASCARRALAVGIYSFTSSTPVNRLQFGSQGKAVTGGIYNPTSATQGAYLYRLCARRLVTNFRKRTIHGSTTNRLVTGRLHCPTGTAFTQGGYAMSRKTATVVQSRPIRHGTVWTVTARFPRSRSSNTLLLTGLCIP